ncbi:hypothetical protein [Sphingobium mellinum]|uniref:hypothetical protein n=1 Tax=Sphingobium mellinum TaxID=1387166 RepID=UPI0030EB828E
MASSPSIEIGSGFAGKPRPGALPKPVWAVLAWLLCCAVLLWLSRNQLSALDFRDPDDAMRLQQVRDWIGGQAFHDISQHRVNPPAGGPMHWSRIVDMPIAGLILLLRPLLGAALAETVACALVPLLLLGSLAGATFHAARRVTGEAEALLSVALLLTTPTILVQFGALRIDHHGWQILMATVALGGALDQRPARGGIVAGLALATWLQISSEGLPYAALFGAIFALRQCRDDRESARFVRFAMALGGAALPLLLLLRGVDAPQRSQCDALSAAYVWPLVAFTVATPVAFRLIAPRSASSRFVAAGIGAGAAAIVFLFTGWSCLTGDPFQALGPVAYKLWYLQVMEGRPIWEQGRSMAGLILLPPLAGLVASIFATRASRTGVERDRWIVVTILLIGATLVAVMVMRAMSVAHVFALPGLSWLMLRLFQQAQRQTRAVIRVFTSSAVALLTPAALCALWIAATAGAEDTVKGGGPTNAGECRTTEALAPLRTLPPSTLFAPLDMGPDILIRTRHRVIGTAHHRNAAGITAVVEGFTAPPVQARAIIANLNGGRGPDYLIACTSLNEFRHYATEHRGSLAATLDQGRPPSWLKPVQLRGAKALRVYQIIPARS